MSNKQFKTKKVRTYFFRNKEVVAEKKKLISLIKDINYTMNISNSLSLYNFNDFLKFIDANKEDLLLSKMELNSRLKYEHLESFKKASKLDLDIKMNQIDFILTKIRIIQKIIDEE